MRLKGNKRELSGVSRRIERAGRQQKEVEPRRRQVPTSHLRDAQIRKWPDAVVSYINRTATPLRAPRGPPDPEALANSILPGTSPFVILCLGNMIENIREPQQASFHQALAKQLPVATSSSS